MVKTMGDVVDSELARNFDEDEMEARWVAYLVYCTVGNKCYLLREEKMEMLVVMKYGRRLDP